MPDEPVRVTSSTGTLRLGQAPEREERPEAPSAKAEKRVPLGAPLDRTDEELDALAEVSLQDLEETQALVRKNATELGRALWEAPPADET
jgi:hypothetical protein